MIGEIAIGDHVVSPGYNNGEKMEVVSYRAILSEYRMGGQVKTTKRLDTSNVWCRWVEDGKVVEQEFPVSMLKKV